MRSIVTGPKNVLGSVDDEESVALTCNEVREISRSFKTQGNVAEIIKSLSLQLPGTAFSGDRILR